MCLSPKQVLSSHCTPAPLTAVSSYIPKCANNAGSLVPWAPVIFITFSHPFPIKGRILLPTFGPSVPDGLCPV